MARNRYAGYCYKCGVYVPPGYGHFQKTRDPYRKWLIHCVKCASGRIIDDNDSCVKAIKKLNQSKESCP